jgi:cell division control protein 6
METGKSQKDLFEDLFSKALQSRIFINRELLSPDYVPQTLPFREEQLAKLASILSVSLKNERPNNVFIYGLTGTGKTAAVKLVFKKLKEKADEIKANVVAVYVNTRQKDTEYRVLAEVLDSLGVKVPFTGLSVSELYNRLFKAVQNKGSITIVALDEIDYLVKKHGDDLLYRLLRMNSELQRGKITIVGITNDLKLIDSLDPRVKSSLGEEEIVFPPYDAEQLKKILEERARLAFREGALSPEVIPLCAALAAREHGDARKALDLLRTAGEIAERNNDEKVETRHVEMARNQLEHDTVEAIVSTLPLHSKLILLATLKIIEEKGKATTGEVYSKYLDLVKKLGIEYITSRRATDIISELDMLGILDARVTSRGRYGKTKTITLQTSKEAVLKALLKDELIGAVINE